MQDELGSEHTIPDISMNDTSADIHISDTFRDIIGNDTTTPIPERSHSMYDRIRDEILSSATGTELEIEIASVTITDNLTLTLNETLIGRSASRPWIVGDIVTLTAGSVLSSGQLPQQQSQPQQLSLQSQSLTQQQSQSSLPQSSTEQQSQFSSPQPATGQSTQLTHNFTGWILPDNVILLEGFTPQSNTMPEGGVEVGVGYVRVLGF